MKKVLSFVLAGAMVLSLAACGDPGSTSGQAPGSAGSSTQVTEVTGLTEPIAETPALITSAGQSADASMPVSYTHLDVYKRQGQAPSS